MYAPRSPEPEWIELTTLTDYHFHLCTIGDALKAVPLPEFMMSADTYCIITKDTVLFKEKYPLLNGKLIYAPVPALNNDKDIVYLRDSSGRILDSVAYSNKWGGGSGRSLERKDIDEPSDSLNFSQCLDSLSATPLAPNSVRRRDHDLAVTDILGDTGTFTITTMITNVGKKSVTLRSLSLIHREELIRSIPLNVSIEPKDVISYDHHWEEGIYGRDTIRAVIDAENDEIAINNILTKVVTFNVPLGAVQINEIMFHPASSSCQWIELYNASSYRIKSDHLILSLQDRMQSAQYVTFTGADIVPKQLFIVSANEKIYNAYPSLRGDSRVLIAARSTFSLDNAAGNISWCNRDTSLIGEFIYDESFTMGNRSKPIGTSLERRSLNDMVHVNTNWGSSIDRTGATPLLSNSLTNIQLADVHQITISCHPNPFSPNNDGFEDDVMITISLPADDEHDISIFLYFIDRK